MTSIAKVTPPQIHRPEGPGINLYEFTFDYRKQYDLGKKIYYTYWQFVKSSDMTWSQKDTGDAVKENVYPGKDFKFTQYTPGQLVIATDPADDKYTPGQFEDKDSKYPLVDLSKEYTEDTTQS
jgi:hypothetical protein